MGAGVKKMVATLGAVSILAGCVGIKTPTYSSDYVAIDALKAYKLKKVAVEDVAPKDVEDNVNKITLRGANLVVENGTFATYLQNAMINDLKEISIYDKNSSIKLNLTILKNDIDVSGFSTGTGEMEIALRIVGPNGVLLEKNYYAVTQFDSAFGAIVAVPKGQSEYPKLVQKLLSTVYSDQQFINAISYDGAKNAKNNR
jgi:hypothetical protein